VNIAVYNTLTRQREVIVPADPERVTMYACGPTVYNYAHIGNARPAVIFDLLRRVLAAHFPHVVYVRNITDVDDKINARAQELGVPIGAISAQYTAAYRDDMAALGVAPPDHEPAATEYIPEIVALIARLLERGCAYRAAEHVLFDVQHFAEYGALSRRDRREMIAGARVEVAPYKRNPEDFVLWKPSTPDLPGWDSPWGRGRPGWHVECSAMAGALLGESIDLHCGGQDLIFPHHENEIAQSRCAYGHPHFARYWVHNGFVQVDSRKMAKSVGNVLLVRDLLAAHPGETLRYLLLTAHYRQPLDWTADAVHQAQRTLDRLYTVLRDHGGASGETPGAPEPAFVELLADDLNTPQALAEINRLGRELANAANDRCRATLARVLRSNADFLGLLQQEPEAWLQQAAGGATSDVARIESLIDARNRARAARAFAEADRLRDELTALGVCLEDQAGGTRWRWAR